MVLKLVRPQITFSVESFHAIFAMPFFRLEEQEIGLKSLKFELELHRIWLDVHRDLPSAFEDVVERCTLLHRRFHKFCT